EVAENHTYLVTDQGVVVHNANPEEYSLLEAKVIQEMKRSYSVDPATVAKEELLPLLFEGVKVLGVLPKACRGNEEQCVAIVDNLVNLREMDLDPELIDDHPTSVLGMELARSEIKAMKAQLGAEIRVLQETMEIRKEFLKGYTEADYDAMDRWLIEAGDCFNADACDHLTLRFKEILDQRKLLEADVARHREVLKQYTNGIQTLSRAESKFKEGHFRTGMEALGEAEYWTVRRHQFEREVEALKALNLRDWSTRAADTVGIPGTSSNSPLSAPLPGNLLFPSEQRALNALPQEQQEIWSALLRFPWLPAKVRADFSLESYKYIRNQREKPSGCHEGARLPTGSKYAKIIECY
ncbi:MAG: hypothetical protein KDK23_15445, partial [Leptospiraceae bacterium]|nr:hypothetical protein [Leptospiraceae bacterium]